ncbi:hypothetical protein ACUOFC_57445, partial [Escherichia sp. TWPC-MK]
MDVMADLCGASCGPRLPYLFTSEVPNMDFRTIPSTATSIMEKIPLHQLSWMYVETSAALNDSAIDGIVRKSILGTSDVNKYGNLGPQE